ncbi:hypothetical protein GCM10008955_39290 [Deinococcus malanensis]|uniref:Peptidase MA-like domain-containing protein n=1 Tax=Deinococcus malanensis TaxID=1706855 RepID=A0ABQ2F538_9DEIO|nr:peptidase MA family metallohydrolase [Deinococcus malanensis]GGK41631.1 hypothetical protein GCM10008955_39290 [Deinococcus malanensis]
MSVLLTASNVRAAGPDSPAGLVNAMQEALVRRDATAYLALVDLREPMFATEHRRFVQDWVARPPQDLRLTLSDVREISGQTLGQLRWSWRTAANVQRDVTLTSTFRKVGGEWRYAGEAFPVTLAQGRVLAQAGQEEVAGAIATNLDATISLVRRALGYGPSQPPVVKLYGSYAALSASVQLSLQPVGGWNEPGEAIKLAAPRWPESRVTLAHELAHAAVFSRFGEGQIRIPWWLHEGLAHFVASGIWTEQARATYLQRSITWHTRGELVAWDRLSNFEATPGELWPHVYGQGYAFVRYAVSRYGMPRVTSFMHELAAGQSTQVASTRAFGATFDQLDKDWKAWLGTQAVKAARSREPLP